MDPKRFLAPLDAEREAIRQLSEYGTAEQLGEAVQRVAAAVDRVLRLMLREDRAVPDSIRLAALSEDQPVREVVTALRRADTITMELAAGVEQLREAAGRAGAGAAKAADADVAQDVLRRLMDAIAGAGKPAPSPIARPEPAASQAPMPPRRVGRTLLLGAVLLVAGGSFVWLALRDTAPTGQAGADAFAAGRLAEAEEIFRFRVGDGRGSVTDWLYLGRIYRRTGRVEDAAAALRTAVDANPEDADVRRELGWLFMDLDRPGPASEQFEVALEIEPGEPLSWIGLIQALRQAGDPSADDWLARAPREARDRLGSTGSLEPSRQ